ncbi:MAG: hypothetical protein IT328_22700 [Caldilineaceae bacterium]|nr:hypothetical protein [Caldilineaceae bacterium]
MADPTNVNKAMPAAPTVGTLLAHPCRNFNILGVTTLHDPKDGRQKIVLSSFAAGSTGKLIFIDAENGAGEEIMLPGDEGAWALYNLDDQRLLVGTCARSGYLHALELADREWLEPLRDPNETYIWNLCRGSNGLVYGGTYNGCVLLRYDPTSHRLDNVGRASPNKDNLYSRYVYSEIPGKILVACGMAEMHLTLYDLATGAFERFGPAHAQVKQISADHLWVEAGDTMTCYATRTLAEVPLDQAPLPEPLPAPYSGSRHEQPLGDGRIYATRGQEYYIFSPTASAGEPLPPLAAIPTERPPTRVHTLIADSQGKLWGASGFGQTIFSYDPDSGTMWNSHVVCDQGGEVYGMAFSGQRLFMSAYSGGDHIVYDPALPWEQVSNHNPRTLQSVFPDYIRPEGRSVIGPDGHFWTGWLARYGVYGGAISRVDVDTLEVTVWKELVPEQAVMAIAADTQYLYFTTGGAGNGLPSKEEPFAFGVLSSDGSLLHQHLFPKGRHPGQIVTSPAQTGASTQGSVIVAVDDELWPFDPQHFTWGEAFPVGTGVNCLLALAEGGILVFAAENLWRLAAGQLTSLGTLPGPVRAATQAPDGRIYFAAGTGVYQL